MGQRKIATYSPIHMRRYFLAPSVAFLPPALVLVHVCDVGLYLLEFLPVCIYVCVLCALCMCVYVRDVCGPYLLDVDLPGDTVVHAPVVDLDGQVATLVEPTPSQHHIYSHSQVLLCGKCTEASHIHITNTSQML